MATQLKSLRNEDLTDRELLHIVNDESDPDGFANTNDIATRLGIGGKRKHNSVGVRLGYMRLLGWLERDSEQKPSEPTRWRLTDLGMQIMGGKLKVGVERALDTADIGQQVLIMRNITKRGMVQGGRSKGMALSREFRHNAAQMNGKP